MTAQTILIAGAGGHTGTYIVEHALKQGYSLRLLTRSKSRLQTLYPKNLYPTVEIFEADITNPVHLRGVCTGVDGIISTVGASLDMNDMRDRKSFHEIDFVGNANLLKEAVQSGFLPGSTKKFVYLSAFGAETTDTAYTNEHEAFVRLLLQSGCTYSVVRPTGFFYVNAEFLSFAKRGFGMVIGDGTARTNPIHEEDVAKACVDALQSNEKNIEIGGAETFTRAEIIDMAFRAVGKKSRITHIPFAVMSMGSRFTRLFNPRIADIMYFGATVSVKDCVAPPVKTEHRLQDYFHRKIHP